MTQASEILAYMRRGRAITPLVALAQFSCFRLSARILDLKRLGHRIERQMVTVLSGKKVARYRLKRAA